VTPLNLIRLYMTYLPKTSDAEVLAVDGVDEGLVGIIWRIAPNLIEPI